MKIKAISLWEPWASLIATGAKTIETRSWPTSYRGPLLICAAKKRDTQAMDLLKTAEFQRGLRPLVKADQLKVYESNLNFGKAVAIVNLVRCLMTEVLCDEDPDYPENEIEFGDYRPERFAWLFDRSKIQRIVEPFAVKGSQGFFEVEVAEDLKTIII